MDLFQKKSIENRKLCCVPGCNNRTLSFHKFPNKGENNVMKVIDYCGDTVICDQLTAWKKVLNINNINSNTVICSLHFDASQYMLNDRSKLIRELQPTAVPNCHLPRKLRLKQGQQENHEVCSLCLTNSKSIRSILSEDRDGILLKNKLEYVLNDTNFNSKVLENICLSCKSALYFAFQFKRRCIESLVALSEQIETDTIKEETQSILENKDEMMESSHLPENQIEELIIKEEPKDIDDNIEVFIPPLIADTSEVKMEHTEMTDSVSVDEQQKCLTYTSKKRPSKHFSVEDKEKIINIFKNTCKQYPNNNKTENVIFAAKVAGVSDKSVYNILREYKLTKELHAPKAYHRKKPILDRIDDEVKSKLTRLVHSLYENNQPPTLNKVMAAIAENEDMVQLKRTTLYVLLKEIRCK